MHIPCLLREVPRLHLLFPILMGDKSLALYTLLEAHLRVALHGAAAQQHVVLPRLQAAHQLV